MFGDVLTDAAEADDVGWAAPTGGGGGVGAHVRCGRLSANDWNAAKRSLSGSHEVLEKCVYNQIRQRTLVSSQLKRRLVRYSQISS